jgi:hypothetical protein
MRTYGTATAARKPDPLVEARAAAAPRPAYSRSDLHRTADAHAPLLGRLIQLRFHAGNAHTHLGDTAAAFAAQDRALRLCLPGNYTDWALTLLDRAGCHIHHGDADQALSDTADTLTSLTAAHRWALRRYEPGRT